MPAMTATPAHAIDASAAERAVRRILMATLLLGVAGITTDLLLLNHIEDRTQLIPFAALGLTLLSLLAHAALRSAATVRLVQVLTLVLLSCGALGVYLHFQGNAAFQRELAPEISGGDLFWKSMRAKAPPALAPLAFVQLAFVGWAWSFRHPLLRAANQRH